MPTFAYRIADAGGRTLEGCEDAVSAAALERVLSARGFYPIEVHPQTERSEARRAPVLRGRRADVVDGTRYLATLLGAGFPLDQALEVVQRLAGRADVTAAWDQVRRRVRAGGSLADALAEHPRIFPGIAAGLARAGERGGRLTAALDELATQLERERALRARLGSALLYPLVLATAGGAALLVLLLYVLPRFASVIEEAGAALPRSTALLVDTAAAVGRWWPVLLLCAVAAPLALGAAARTPWGRRKLDAALVTLPLVGSIAAAAASVRFARSLGSTLAGGAPVLAALDVSAAAVGNSAVAEEVRDAAERVRAGSGLASALGRGGCFAYEFLRMVEVGEKGGRLPEMLARAAVMLEQGLERRLDRLVRLAEPIMILLFGGAVGFVALALLQAIYGFRANGF